MICCEIRLNSANNKHNEKGMIHSLDFHVTPFLLMRMPEIEGMVRVVACFLLLYLYYYYYIVQRSSLVLIYYYQKNSFI